jgi:MFS family permease
VPLSRVGIKLVSRPCLDDSDYLDTGADLVSGTNGANLSFPEAFGLDAPEGTANYERDFWIIGLVNSAPYIASAFLGCWLSDPCNHYFGRRGTIFISAIFLIATPIGGAVCQTWQELFVTRLLMGIGMGLKGSTTPVFAAENSPAAIRGYVYSSGVCKEY